MYCIERSHPNSDKSGAREAVRSATRLLTSLLFAHISLSTAAYALPSDQGEAYDGEYVVTLPRFSRRVESAGVAAQSVGGDLREHVTVLRTLNSNAALVSSGVMSHAASSPDNKLEGLSVPQTPLGDLFCKDLLARHLVDSCTPNYRLSVDTIAVADPMMGELWGLASDSGVNATTAWEITTGSPSVVVAVIDTGIDYTHPDLAGNIWTNPGEVAGNGLDDDGNGFVDDVHGANTSSGALNPGDPFDDNRHGTHVAGTIGALHGNGIGVSGINQSVTLLPIKFLDATGSGRLSDAVQAIDYMVDLKVNHGVNIRVVNNSWGGGGYSPAMEASIQRARDAGIVFVAAAGNDGQDIDLFPAYPASYEVDNVVAVAAVDRDLNLASFSNFGAESVDIAAPGVDIVSTLPGGQYGYLSGTSMATPHVVGSLALLFAAEPSLTVPQAIERLYETGRDLSSLIAADPTVGLIATRRMVEVNRLVRNQSVELPIKDGGLPPCGYSLSTSRLGPRDAVDSGADLEPIVIQVDEGSFYKVSLPFDFPFFRTTTRTIYVSPNGLVYLNEPSNPDYQVAARAPNNSIAAFQTDLIPRTAKQGVRVHKEPDHVTVYWLLEHYSLPGQGPISVRLTIYQGGLIATSVTFESMQDPVAASHAVLGNPFASPPIASLGLIGASATSSRLSSTLDLAAAQQRLISGGDQRLDLRAIMTPTCFSIPDVQTKINWARIDSIRFKLSRNRKRADVRFQGVGSGKIPLVGYVNGASCPQGGWGKLTDGVGRVRVSVPKGVRKLAIRSASAQDSLVVAKASRRSSRAANLRLCSQVMRGLN